MATSGYTNVVFTNWDTLRFSWWIESQSVANNETELGWKLEIISTAYGYITPLYNRAWSVTIDGQTFSGRVNLNIQNNETEFITSGTKTIKHNSDGSKTFSYSFMQNLNITFSDVKIDDVNGNGTGVLQQIPRAATITNAPNFNDEQNPTITYSNPAGNAVTALEACISFTGTADDVPYRAVNKTGTSYTFPLTENERKKLRQWVTAGSDSREVIFYLRTNIGGTNYHSTAPKTLTIINDTPTLSPTVEITDALTKNLTGNSNTIIKDVSTVSYAINPQAYKEAAINGYWVQNNGAYKYDLSGTFTNLQSGYFLFAASDNRGRHIRAEVTKTLVNYVKLTCDADVSIALTSEELATITLKIHGNYFNGTFGAAANTLALSYRYKTNDGEYSNWVNLANPTLNGNTYELTVTIENLDYRNAYTVQCAASDKVANVSSTERTIKAIPVFDWGKNDFNFNVPIKIQGQPVADFIIEQGTVSSWNYRKWNSGVIEAWHMPTINVTTATAYGSGYYNGSVLGIDIPTGLFKYKPTISIICHPANAQLYSVNVADMSATEISYYISSMKSNTATSMLLNVTAYGFWK